MPDTGPPKRVSAKRRERMAKALEYRRAGLDYRTIGERLGVSHTIAHHDVRDALHLLVAEPAEDVRRLELERLDVLLRVALDKAIRHKDMRAVETVLKIMDRRAKYLGLDVPEATSDVQEVQTLLTTLIHGDNTP